MGGARGELCEETDSRGLDVEIVAARRSAVTIASAGIGPNDAAPATARTQWHTAQWPGAVVSTLDLKVAGPLPRSETIQSASSCPSRWLAESDVANVEKNTPRSR